ncbi:AidA/PixA family protein [Pseudomonas purpurea]|uniref:AidA/PixA family protein n=1 Tax=Pseudomonas purpurea TaxID=3136737 RepID=UPI003263CACF
MSTDTTTLPADTTEQIANLLLIVDAETLLSHYPNPSLDPQQPTSVDDGFILFFGGAHGTSPNAHPNRLALLAGSAKTFHLRTRTVGLRAEHSVVVYAMSVGKAGVLSPPELVVHEGLTLPALDPENLAQPISQNATDHFWRCKQLTAGVEKCTLSFMLVSTDCQALGYFSWTAEVKLSG